MFSYGKDKQRYDISSQKSPLAAEARAKGTINFLLKNIDADKRYLPKNKTYYTIS